MKDRHIDMGIDPTANYPSLQEELDVRIKAEYRKKVDIWLTENEVEDLYEIKLRDQSDVRPQTIDQYAVLLEDYTHDQLVQLVADLDSSAKEVGKQIEHKAVTEHNLRAAIDAMHSKQLLVKTALRDLFEFAEMGEYSGLNRDEDEMDDE